MKFSKLTIIQKPKKMKNVIVCSLFLLGGIASVSAATLEASTNQPVYSGTTCPLLSIVSGSGKTSYVGGTIGDPCDPAATEGIYFNAPSGSVLTFTSSNTNVVKVADITATELASGLFAVRIKPTGVGKTTITVKLSGASNYKIEYAASKANNIATRWFYGSSDASAIADAGGGYFFVADDETNIIRLHNTEQSGMPLAKFDATSMAGGTSSEEYDVEGASSSDDGKTIYWIASLSNNKSGKEKPYRNRVFSTKVTGTGTGAKLSAGAYSTKMRDALIAFGDANGWDFTASASFKNKMIPKRIDGFNIEGLTLRKGGGAAYIGFRAPCVPLKGVTPTSSNRKYAVMAMVSNFEAMLSGSGQSSIAPQVATAPILFDFGGLGIRAIERVGDYYVIIAGLFEGGGTPKAYLWDGTIHADASPFTAGDGHLTEINIDMSDLVQQTGSEVEGHPEAVLARQEGNNLIINLVCDNGSVDFYGDGNENKVYSADTGKYPWGKFRMDTFVYPMPSPSGVSTIAMQPTMGIALTNGILTVGNLTPGTPVVVTTADGTLVGSAIATASTLSMPLPNTSSVYIVRAGDKVVKVYTR